MNVLRNTKLHLQSLNFFLKQVVHVGNLECKMSKSRKGATKG